MNLVLGLSDAGLKLQMQEWQKYYGLSIGFADSGLCSRQALNRLVAAGYYPKELQQHHEREANERELLFPKWRASRFHSVHPSMVEEKPR